MAQGDGTGHLTTDELFRRHADFVARFLARLGVPSEQLEDALQEVFLVAHRNGGYRPGLAKPTSYLANIALRAAARHRQRDGRARSRHSEVIVDELVSEHQDPARAAQIRQDMRRLQLALARLPEELCTALLLVEMEGESCVSVAAGLGCPVGTIYWRVHQARKQLRAALQSVDAADRSAGREQPELDERVQSARSFMMFFGLGGFKDTEAARLLQLAREQSSSRLAIDQLLARHHALIQTGVELPAWASSVATQSASWGVVLGPAPILASFAAGGTIAAVALLSTQAPMLQPAREQAKVRATQPAVSSAAQAPGHDRERNLPRPRAEPAGAQTEPLREDRLTPAKPNRDRDHDSAEARTGRTDRASAFDGDDGSGQTGTAAEPSASAEPARTAPREPRARSTRAEPRAAQPAAQPASERTPEPDPQVSAAQRMERAMTDAELAEMREIARAERLLSEEPQRALALARAMEAGFPEGRFREERAYLEVMALAELGRSGELREKAAAFLRSYPAGLYSQRVRRAIGRGD